ncbi:glycosyl transferase [Paenibacillus sp.]|uniref:glycosyl transferase n=1 Tax=Paenibacillus sp. TaxID=58172 RepID=UPI002D43B786|nr:glycosyl transferase [Paenibacillus sp.]HZG84245.1 glycosyl transferase [Paenibacillus sp.]
MSGAAFPGAIPFRHLRRMTDDVGVVEHALGVVPRRKEGYSADDQARALWACLEWLDLAGDDERNLLYDLIDTYLAFLLWVQRDDGHFHNNIAYDRSPEPETPSDDCLGRCLWAGALAYAKLEHDPDRRIAAERLVAGALTRVDEMVSPRGWAYAAAAAALLAKRGYPADAERKLALLEGRLLEAYRGSAMPDWRWFEPIVAYSNGLMPWGLLCAYDVRRNDSAFAAALDSLDFLIGLTVADDGRIRPVGNRGWCVPGRRADWDQQPIDVWKLMLAAAKAYELTERPKYRDVAVRCREWFRGDNDGGAVMADERDGGCRDGLAEDGANLNQGVESTISFLLAEALYRKMFA